MKPYIIAALAVWILSAAAAMIKHTARRRRRIFNPLTTLLAGTFMAEALLEFPLYFLSGYRGVNFSADPMWARVWKSALMSLYRAIKLDGDFDAAQKAADILAQEGERGLALLYSVLVPTVYMLAIVLAIGVVLSFFRNVGAYRRYLMSYFREVYVFTELNERSAALAQSIAENRRCTVVFANVAERYDEKSSLLRERAYGMGAICFKKDILSLKLGAHSSRKSMSFFAIGTDDADNIKRALGIIDEYHSRANTKLYVVSRDIDAGVILNSADKGSMAVICVREARSLIYRMLYDMECRAVSLGEPDIFAKAKPSADGVGKIGAVIVGMGKYGTEMIKALSWFCQMDGYELSIDAFDMDDSETSVFEARCPGLMSCGRSGEPEAAADRRMINIHSAKNVFSADFAEEIKELKNTTLVFVSLGADEINIKAALTLRLLFEKENSHPDIYAAVYNTDLKKAHERAQNSCGQMYDIKFIGDLQSLYSKEVIINRELEDEAKQIHLQWGEEGLFWRNEYNYSSSQASALHARARIACKLQGADKHPDELSDEEKELIGKIEHRRWSVYMRSEGYVYGERRNDLGQQHHDLVDYSSLDSGEQTKNKRMAVL